VETVVVLVDVSNVRRSRWPNVTELRLVEAVRHWAASEGVAAELVFDGPAPFDAPDLLGSGREPADDVLARRAAELRAAGRPFRLVTSDRALRADAGRGAEGTIGGGAFLGLLGLR
jgi:hypothetical protein